MIRPKTISILGKNFKIVYVKHPKDVNLNDPDAEDWGRIIFSKREIRVYDGEEVAESDVLDTVIHEITHGICSELGIDLSEKDTQAFASVFTDTMIRNKYIKVGRKKKVAKKAVKKEEAEDADE